MSLRGKTFSLKTFLLVVLIVCLGVSHFLASRRLQRAEQELLVLRGQLGYLSIDDDSKFHAITVDSGEEQTWQWRCYFPKGYCYSIHAASKGIPANGVPGKNAMGSYSNHEVKEGVEALVTARLRKADDGNWRLSVTCRAGGAEAQCIPGVALNIPSEDLAWQGNHPSVLSGTIGQSKTHVQSPSEPMIMRTYRPYYDDETKLGSGYIFWFSARPVSNVSK